MNPKQNTSLIEAGKAQMELLSSAQMPGDFFVVQEAHGEFTGERFFSREPEKYRLVVSLLAEKLGVIRIGRVVGVSPNTVLAVRDREGLAVDIEKKSLASKAMAAAHLAVEGVLEDLSDPVRRSEIETRDKALIAAMMTDKGLLLNGEATVRLDVAVHAPDHDDYNRYLASLKSVNPTGLAGENAGQNAGLTAASSVTGKALQES